jgi:hypothetical protein
MAAAPRAASGEIIATISHLAARRKPAESKKFKARQKAKRQRNDRRKKPDRKRKLERWKDGNRNASYRNPDKPKPRPCHWPGLWHSPRPSHPATAARGMGGAGAGGHQMGKTRKCREGCGPKTSNSPGTTVTGLSEQLQYATLERTFEDCAPSLWYFVKAAGRRHKSQSLQCADRRLWCA